MAGKKGQIAWNKREVYDFNDLIKLSKSDLLRLGMRYRSKAGKVDDKMYKRWLEIATAIVIKAMPTKLNGSGIGIQLILIRDKQEELDGNKTDTLQINELPRPLHLQRA